MKLKKYQVLLLFAAILGVVLGCQKIQSLQSASGNKPALSKAGRPATLETADALFHEGHASDAQTIVQEILSKDPNNESAHNLLGLIYINQKKSQEAMKEFEEILRLNPQAEYAHRGMGWAYYMTNDFHGAEQEFKTALGMKLTMWGYDGLAETYLAMKKKPEAITAFEEASKYPGDEPTKNHVIQRLNSLRGHNSSP